MSAATRLGSQIRFQALANIRSGVSLALGTLVPVFFFVGFALLFGGDVLGGDGPIDLPRVGEVPTQAFYAGGMMAYGLVFGAFAGLVPELVGLREQGVLKRLRGTPMPQSTFVAARFVIALIIALLGTAGVAIVANVFFDLEMRSGGFVGWLLYVVVGSLTWTILSFAATAFMRNEQGAQGFSNIVVIVLAMTSGIFFDSTLLPSVVTDVTRWFPLEPLANGLQSLYAPGVATLTSNDFSNLAILSGWGVAGALVAWLRFRWDPRQRRS